MARDQQVTTLSPLHFREGQYIISHDVAQVVWQLNWSAGKRPEVHFSGDIKAPTRGDAGWVEMRRGFALIREETSTVEVSAEATIAGGNDVDVRVTVGGASVTLNFTATGVQSGTLTASSIPQGAPGVLWTIEVRRNAGSAGDSTVDRVRIQDQALTAIPAPVDE